MIRLIAGARASLMPSFAEGFGLPVAEALAIGTPVIASDIPVFHEVGQGLATLIDPLDGPEWEAAIMAHWQDEATFSAARSRATRFVPQTSTRYYTEIMRAIGVG
jgi:glycosyltransferase involved in cell wall biosynthesis